MPTAIVSSQATPLPLAFADPAGISRPADIGLVKVDVEDLRNRVQLAKTNLASVAEGNRYFGKSHTDYTWALHNLSHDNLARNISQVLAELNQKRNALVEAEYSWYEKRAEAEMLEEEANACPEDQPNKRMYLKVKAEKMRALSQLAYEPVLGCTKDIAQLTALHDQLKARIIEKYGKFDETVVVQAEEEYWVHRSLRQSIRDIRQYGAITKGEQELLEQGGMDPNIVEKLLKGFIYNQNARLAEQEKINQERMQRGEAPIPIDITTNELDAFLDAHAAKLKDCFVNKLRHNGIDYRLTTAHLVTAHLPGDSGA